MGLFSAIVGVTIETVKLPIAVLADMTGQEGYTEFQIDQIKEAADKFDQ